MVRRATPSKETCKELFSQHISDASFQKYVILWQLHQCLSKGREVSLVSICMNCKHPTLPLSLQEGERALDTWRSTVESVHSDVGYAPAMAMLSAYGFYEGQTRNDPGGGPAVRTGDLRLSMPGCVPSRDTSCTMTASRPACSQIQADLLVMEWAGRPHPLRRRLPSRKATL